MTARQTKAWGFSCVIMCWRITVMCSCFVWNTWAQSCTFVRSLCSAFTICSSLSLIMDVRLVSCVLRNFSGIVTRDSNAVRSLSKTWLWLSIFFKLHKKKRKKRRIVFPRSCNGQILCERWTLTSHIFNSVHVDYLFLLRNVKRHEKRYKNCIR